MLGEGIRGSAQPRNPQSGALPLFPTCFLAQSLLLPLLYFPILGVLAPHTVQATPKAGSGTTPRASGAWTRTLR